VERLSGLPGLATNNLSKLKFFSQTKKTKSSGRKVGKYNMQGMARQ
jgi:hypothetical protein